MKIVINNCHGGFGLSTEAMLQLVASNSSLIKQMSFDECGLKDPEDFRSMEPTDQEGLFVDWVGVIYRPETKTVYTLDVDPVGLMDDHNDYDSAVVRVRTHPDLLSVVEQLGVKANGRYSKLKIVEITDEDITTDDINVAEYDGAEWVEEKHRTWN